MLCGFDGTLGSALVAIAVAAAVTATATATATGAATVTVQKATAATGQNATVATVKKIGCQAFVLGAGIVGGIALAWIVKGRC